MFIHSSDPFQYVYFILTLIKLNEPVDLVCVIFTPVQFSLIQDSVWEGSEGEEDQQEEAALGKDPEEAEMNSLPVRVTIMIRNEKYTRIMTTCNKQCFSFHLTPLLSS